ncbi:Protein F39H12.3 [Aphelenchoides avenae]|nr:Protein F39H12.3 [Aphelenchus avenae]
MAGNLTDKYKVPAGLRPLLEAFARETIRTQPDDLVRFGQVFFDVLRVHKNQNPKTDVINDPVNYDMFKTDLQQKWKAPPQASQASHEAFASQQQQEEQQEQQEGSPRPISPEDLAATKIQAVYRGHFVRNHPERFGIDSDVVKRRMSNISNIGQMHPVDNKKDQKRHSIGGYSLVNPSPEDRAATKIQSEIRGFLTRKHVNAMKVENDKAAKKIQAHVRGYLTRKHLEEEGVSPSRSRNSIASNHSMETATVN